MSEISPNLALPLLAASQAQKHVTHNEALLALDALVHLSVASRGLVEPPAAPTEGERYLVAGEGGACGAVEVARLRVGARVSGIFMYRKTAGSPGFPMRSGSCLMPEEVGGIFRLPSSVWVSMLPQMRPIASRSAEKPVCSMEELAVIGSRSTRECRPRPPHSCSRQGIPRGRNWVWRGRTTSP